MSQATQTDPNSLDTGLRDTGPQAVLELNQQGLSYRDIAELLHLSPATVSRRIKDAREELATRRRTILVNLMFSYLVVLATIATASLAALAWG